MSYEDALKLLKEHYNWRITAHFTHPDGRKGVIVVDDERDGVPARRAGPARGRDCHWENLSGGQRCSSRLTLSPTPSSVLAGSRSM